MSLSKPTESITGTSPRSGNNTLTRWILFIIISQDRKASRTRRLIVKISKISGEDLLTNSGDLDVDEVLPLFEIIVIQSPHFRHQTVPIS